VGKLAFFKANDRAEGGGVDAVRHG
jgi:hypothetical protein